MVGAGKTVVLSRIARNQTIVKTFSGGIYWMRAGFDTLDSYKRVVGIGKMLKQDIRTLKRPQACHGIALNLDGGQCAVDC